MFDLKGKVALVTGAAAGIGLAYVKELLNNRVKAVALVDINTVRGQEALEDITKTCGNKRAIFVKADVCVRSELEVAFETTVKTFGQLDIVINNAGIVQELQWEKCVAVNLTAAITGSMLAIEKYFPKYKGGPEAVILNTASMTAIAPEECIPTYTATKSGLIGFTRAIGGDLHYKTTKVRMIAICPGFTQTDLAIVTEQQISQPYLRHFQRVIESSPGQTVESLTKNAINLIKTAPTGSVWLAISGNYTLVEFPNYC